MTGEVCTLAGDFLSLPWDVEWCLLFKGHYLLSWDGPLKVREQEMTNMEGEDKEWKAEGYQLDLI